ncbi:MAG: hypothetical protein ACRDGM_02965, partial [bacterium]
LRAAGSGGVDTMMRFSGPDVGNASETTHVDANYRTMIPEQTGGVVLTKCGIVVSASRIDNHSYSCPACEARRVTR